MTHTEITNDPRILKELRVLSKCASNTILGLGTKHSSSEALGPGVLPGADLKGISLSSKSFTFLPKTLRHILTFAELTFKFLYISIKFKPDIVHCHDVIVLPLGSIVKLLCRSKLIYDAHELESDRNGITRFQGFLTKFFEKSLWFTVDSLIVVSDSIGEWYVQNIGPKNYKVILNSPEIDLKTKFEDNYLKLKFNIKPEDKVFIYIGILGRGRGIDLILEAFADPSRSSSVVFLGYGELAESVKKYSKEHENIFYHEPVHHDEVVSVASSADYGFCLIQNISLSDYLCLPNKLFEYCFAKVPVIASNFPELSEKVAKYNLGFCVDLDINSVMSKISEIENLIEKPVIDLETLADLSWNAQTLKLEKLYDSFLTNKN